MWILSLLDSYKQYNKLNLDKKFQNITVSISRGITFSFLFFFKQYEF